MIASVRGIVLEKREGVCVIEAGGVGYELHVSLATLVGLPPEGSEARLLARHIVREDAQLLYGFAEREEQQLFDLLISVNGVGPRIAMAVLSGLQPARFARAVRDENLAAITAISGVGRKTAERLVIELRDKLGFLPMAAAQPPAAESGSRRGRTAAAAPAGKVLAQSQRFDDAVAALVTLGHPQPLAIETVRRVSADAGEGAEEISAEALLRRALTALSRPTLVNR